MSTAVGGVPVQGACGVAGLALFLVEGDHGRHERFVRRCPARPEGIGKHQPPRRDNLREHPWLGYSAPSGARIKVRNSPPTQSCNSHSGVVMPWGPTTVSATVARSGAKHLGRRSIDQACDGQLVWRLLRAGLCKAHAGRSPSSGLQLTYRPYLDATDSRRRNAFGDVQCLVQVARIDRRNPPIAPWSRQTDRRSGSCAHPAHALWWRSAQV